MKILIPLSLVLSFSLGHCTGASAPVRPSVDTVKVERIDSSIYKPYPSEPLASAGDLIYDVIVYDSLDAGTLTDFRDLYQGAPGVLGFRGNLRRDMKSWGRISGRPTGIRKVWQFRTDFKGAWGGGTGWTGQPLYVEWPDSMMTAFKSRPGALTDQFDSCEVIFASLCGKLYFLNFETGLESRRAIPVDNPIKGTPSLDPRMNGNLYIGQGIPDNPIGHMCINLFEHDRTYWHGPDKDAWRHWGAYDSSPIYYGGYLFWPGENGILYKYAFDGTQMRLHSKMRYKVKGDTGAGIENSMCVHRNYGWFGDNHGDILCVDLNTLQPIWHYDLKDDIDGSIVCRIEKGVPYLYAGSEVDRQGLSGLCRLVKLNGLTGEVVWKNEVRCRKLNFGEKHFDGGQYCTALFGRGDCDGMMFLTLCQIGDGKVAYFCAIDTVTGDFIYKVPMKYFAWNSPVGFYNEKDELFVYTADSRGNHYIFAGKTGEMLYCEKLTNVLESSPVVVGNQFVVGSRGRDFYKFEIVSE